MIGSHLIERQEKLLAAANGGEEKKKKNTSRFHYYNRGSISTDRALCYTLSAASPSTAIFKNITGPQIKIRENATAVQSKTVRTTLTNNGKISAQKKASLKLGTMLLTLLLFFKMLLCFGVYFS